MKNRESSGEENQSQNEQYIEITDPQQLKKLKKKFKDPKKDDTTQDLEKNISKVPIIVQDDRKKIQPVFVDDDKAKNQKKDKQKKKSSKGQAKYKEATKIQYKVKQQKSHAPKYRLKQEQKKGQYKEKKNIIDCSQFKRTEDLVKNIEQILKQYKEATVKAVDRDIEFGLGAVHQIHYKYNNLKRINIPGRIILSPQETKSKKIIHSPTITIQLSLKSLNPNNFGYQEKIAFNENLKTDFKEKKNYKGKRKEETRNDDTDSERDYR